MVLSAHQMAAQTPMSAIDWLSNSLTEPADRITNTANPDITGTALPGRVTVSQIAGPSADAVGLLPTSVTGLPANLWGHSRTQTLVAKFQLDPTRLIPATRDLYYTLLLAELDPPFDSTPQAHLYIARLDALLELGALDQAQSLLALSGQSHPDLFLRSFDVSLLVHTENTACETLRLTPELSPTFPARIFCLARGGDWDAAALSLETGRALGFLTHDEDQLLARFLDPVLFENEPFHYSTAHPSPLVFRILEAIGEPMSTATMPRAFAHADLHTNSGWKAQIEATERLTKIGALTPNSLLGIYNQRDPAASGGVWDRVAAIQALDRALNQGDLDAISTALVRAWAEMTRAELEIPFAKLFSDRILKLGLQGNARSIAFDIGMLSDRYEEVILDIPPLTNRQKLLGSIARGQPGDVFAASPIGVAIQDGFRSNAVPARLKPLTDNNRLGEAILLAIATFSDDTQGNLGQLSDALSFFRAVGLEETARRAAIQLLLLDRRG